MYKKFVFAISLALLSQVSFAEFCPSISDIKNNTLHGWKLFDSEDSTPLSSIRSTQFKKDVEVFALAEWTNEHHKEGTIHCYYRNKDGSDLEAYLSKDNFVPQNSKNYWYEVSGFMQCAAGSDKCLFKNNMLERSQLAKK